MGIAIEKMPNGSFRFELHETGKVKPVKTLELTREQLQSFVGLLNAALKAESFKMEYFP